MIRILKPGFYTTIQDAGRFGFQSSGIPVSGAMDLDSYRLANWLVGNLNEEAVLEVTMSGPVLEFESDTYIAITGANMNPQINGIAIENYKTISVQKGSVLSFGKLESGCRAYIAFSGGFDLKKQLGSFSTYTYAEIGGLNGSHLQKNDVLVLGKQKNCVLKFVPQEYHLKSYRLLVVRVVEGIESDAFLQESLDTFYSQEYTIGLQSNRMGYRMNGGALKMKHKNEMISSHVFKGVVQVFNNHQPVVLMSDSQTTGGYPRIANVISADMSSLSQQKPGEKIRFRKVSLEESQALFKIKEVKLKQLLSS